MVEEKETQEDPFIKSEKIISSMKAENDRTEALIKKAQEVKLRDVMGGQTEVKKAEAPKPKELTPEEAARAFEEGKLGNVFNIKDRRI